MSEAAFIDANVPVYAFGGEHRLQRPCRDILREISNSPSACWSSAEVLQELLHIGVRRGQGGRSHETIRILVSLLGQHVVPVDAEHITWCLSREFAPGLQSRDRVHLAVMNRLNITNIISADLAFDGIDGIRRLNPSLLPEWHGLVFA